MFGKKKPAEEAPAPNAAPPPPKTIGNGLVPLMSVSSEVVSVNMQSLPATTFDVPADFKLQK
jgi:hypothetical protein